MMKDARSVWLTIAICFFLVPGTSQGGDGGALKTYPETLEAKPEIASPFSHRGGEEMVVAFLRDLNRYAVVPVTVENGEPRLYSSKIRSLFGKDRQLWVDAGDFPDLARTGLHDETALDGKNMITGYPVEIINCIARPRAFSYAGFLAADEDILSVLKVDNRRVRRMGMTHPQLARPLFHVWNMVLAQIAAGRLNRFSEFEYVLYNGGRVNIRAEGGKGWQVSIFQDEIQGKFNITVQRDPLPAESAFLEERYVHLKEAEKEDLVRRLTTVQFSEMVPFYIMRYGFYEGHTEFRADPIALAFIFGLRTLKELDALCDGDLLSALTAHFTE